MPEFYFALTLWAIGNLCMIVMGFNGIRYARILSLGWFSYIALGGWLFFGLWGLVRLVMAAMIVQADGLPVATIFSSGKIEPFDGIGASSYVSLIASLAFTLFLAAGSYLMVRNARLRDKAEREAASEMHKALFRLKETIHRKR